MAVTGGHADSEEGVYKRLKGHTRTSIILEDDHGSYEYTFPQIPPPRPRSSRSGTL
jgi:hypothetical protein